MKKKIYSLIDISSFYRDFGALKKFSITHWKIILGCPFIGLLIGYGIWSYSSEYKGELLMLNNQEISRSMIESNSIEIDFITWQQIVKKLPTLAGRMLDKKQSKEVFTKLSNQKWWVINVKPVYALLKADVNDQLGYSKNLESGNRILGFLINDSEKNESEVRNNLVRTAEFIRTGGSFLEIEALFNAYEIKLNQESPQIELKITNLKIEEEALRRREAYLDKLIKQYPKESNFILQINSLKAEDVKYMPILNQIIGVKADLESSGESLFLLSQKQEELLLLKKIISQSKELIKSDYDGLRLSENLLKLISEFKKSIEGKNLYKQKFLDQLSLDLILINTRYGIGLEYYEPASPSRSGPWLSLFLGFVFGCFVGFLIALVIDCNRRNHVYVVENPSGKFAE